MTRKKLESRCTVARNLGWSVPENLSAGGMREVWRDVLATLCRCMSTRSIAEYVGLTSYSVQREMVLLGID